MILEEEYSEFVQRDWQTKRKEGPIRIAVIGLGKFARERALPALQQTDLCEATAVVGWTEEKARPVSSEFAIGHAMGYDEFKDGMASDTYDAVYIATPNAFHLEYIEAAAELNKHVLCEKPLEKNAERAKRAVRVCKDTDVTLMTGYRMQVEPVIRRMRELIADEYIGEPVQLNAKFANRLPPENVADEWRVDPDISGGGALIDLGIYPLNTTRFLLDKDPVAVYGTTSTHHSEFKDIDEHVTFELVFPDDVIASCTASLNAYSTSRLEVHGTEGEIKLESPFGGIVPDQITAEREEMKTEYTGSPVNEIIEEFDYFAHCILTNTRPEPDGEDGLYDLNVIEAIYEAAETDCRVTL